MANHLVSRTTTTVETYADGKVVTTLQPASDQTLKYFNEMLDEEEAQEAEKRKQSGSVFGL